VLNRKPREAGEGGLISNVGGQVHLPGWPAEGDGGQGNEELGKRETGARGGGEGLKKPTASGKTRGCETKVRKMGQYTKGGGENPPS